MHLLTTGLELASHFWVVIVAFFILMVALLSPWVVSLDCYQLGICYSQSLPHVDNFVGREEDIRNITGYLDFDHSTIQVVHIVGPPGFGKSTLAKQIGHIFLRKRVKVHYVDIRAVTDMDGFAERVLYSVIEFSKRKITLERLKRWVNEQYSQTLLIIDNCDEILETHRGDFMKSINEMIASPRKSIKYILTSQKWVADVGTYQIHSIYNLSSEAAAQLLSKVAPGLNEDHKRQIAELTGNVPLALDVVGAIFKFPSAPTAEDVIKHLKENPVVTLSPSELHSKVDASIDLAYSYLPPELKELCVNLSHFPASFNQDSVVFIFHLNYDVSPLDLLVQRSLLQFNRPTKRYHFHQLIRSYFLHIQKQNRELAESYFNSKFQRYFASVLYRIIEEEESAALAILDVEKQNLQYMFSLFTTAKHVNYTFYAVKETLIAIDGVLKQRFHPIELCDISQRMIKAMESYTTDEAASHELFLETYAKVVIKAAKLEKQSLIEVDSAIKILSSRKRKIDDGFKSQHISSNTYVQFYSDLAEYYSEKGEDIKSARCHAHILEKVHDQKCNHNCKYLDISVAYQKIRDKVQAFQFRELAYEHQLPSLSHMQQARLFLSLYTDYSNVEVGNNESRAADFSTMIIETVYDYLIIASEPEYLKRVYFDAVDFFRAKNMEDHVIYLQDKMKAIVKEQCSSHTDKCANHHHRSAVDAWKRNCYHLAIYSGIRSLKAIVDPKTRIEIYAIVGKSHYYIGNYTDSQKWLKRALEPLNKDDYPILIKEGRRAELCAHLIAGGDYFNIFCYGYVIKDLVSGISAGLFEHIHVEYSASRTPSQPPTKPRTVEEKGVMEVKYSFIWSLHKKFYTKNSTIKWTMDLIGEALILVALVLVLVLIFLVFGIFVNYSLDIIIYVMSCCCTKKQIRCCFCCATLCIFVFVLGLDVLY